MTNQMTFEMWVKEIHKFDEELRAAGISRNRMRKWNNCTRELGMSYEGFDRRHFEMDRLLLKLWCVQEKLNYVSECLGELLGEYVDDVTEELDMAAINKWKEERRRLFEERWELEDAIGHPETVRRIIETVTWAKW